MPILIQAPCQSRKTAENSSQRGALGDFANQDLVGFPISPRFAFEGRGTIERNEMVGGLGNIRQSRRVDAAQAQEVFGHMIGKLFGAWLGEKIAGPNSRAKGAILGAGAVTIARRAVPAIATLAAIGWGVKKLRSRRSSPAYPSEATPPPPSG